MWAIFESERGLIDNYINTATIKIWKYPSKSLTKKITLILGNPYQ